MRFKNNYMGWFISVFIIFPIFLFIYNKYFIQRNDGEKYRDVYIHNSSDIVIHLPDDFVLKFGHITSSAGRNYARSITYDRMSFFDKERSKYFCIIILEKEKKYENKNRSFQFSMGLENQEIIAKINNEDFENPLYGTSDNPIPILYFKYKDPTLEEKRKFLKDIKLTDIYYKNAVNYYLSYVMPEEEFNKRFKSSD